MKERLFIFGALGLLVILLVGLNAASYVQKEKIPDSEASPNRSTYNTGPTGTRAFYDLLVSTGHQVSRWEKPVSALNFEDTSTIKTFVIVGKTRKEIQTDEISQLLEWVEYGGRLVIIDRKPVPELLKTTGSWSIKTSDVHDSLTTGEVELLLPTVDPSNTAQMTDGETAAQALQPTPFTFGINAVQPSKFATTILIERNKDSVDEISGIMTPGPVVATPEAIPADDEIVGDEYPDDVPSADSDAVIPAESIAVDEPRSGPDENAGETEEDTILQAPAEGPVDVTGSGTETVDEEDDEETIDYTKTAPVIHFGNDKKQILVDFPHGYGTVTVISDPFVISNSGVSLVDNAQMAINVVSNGGGIAFDEYHQGFGSNQNRLLTYFYGTPVVPVFLQLVLFLGLIMLSLSRRFGRPLPLIESSRITKLEYVAAMAQLKRRTKAFDLAVENIYTDFRRRVARLVGVDNHHTKNHELALSIANRSDFTVEEIEEVMSNCEDIIHGVPTNKREVLRLAARIREIEIAIGLRRGRTLFRR